MQSAYFCIATPYYSAFFCICNLAVLATLPHTLTAGSNKKFISNKGRDGDDDRDAESKTLTSLLLLLLASLKRCRLRCWQRCFLFCCWRSVN